MSSKCWLRPVYSHIHGNNVNVGWRARKISCWIKQDDQNHVTFCRHKKIRKLMIVLYTNYKLVANFAPNQWCLQKNHKWKEWDFLECNACLSADDCVFFISCSWSTKASSCLSESQPWASYLPSERTASSPGSLRWPHRNRRKTNSESWCLFSHPRFPLFQCFRKDAALHTKEDFNNKVKTACQEKRTGTVGWGQEGLLRWGEWFKALYWLLSSCFFFFCQV